MVSLASPVPSRYVDEFPEGEMTKDQMAAAYTHFKRLIVRGMLESLPRRSRGVVPRDAFVGYAPPKGRARINVRSLNLTNIARQLSSQPEGGDMAAAQTAPEAAAVEAEEYTEESSGLVNSLLLEMLTGEAKGDVRSYFLHCCER